MPRSVIFIYVLKQKLPGLSERTSTIKDFYEFRFSGPATCGTGRVINDPDDLTFVDKKIIFCSPQQELDLCFYLDGSVIKKMTKMLNYPLDLPTERKMVDLYSNAVIMHKGMSEPFVRFETFEGETFGWKTWKWNFGPNWVVDSFTPLSDEKGLLMFVRPQLGLKTNIRNVHRFMNDHWIFLGSMKLNIRQPTFTDAFPIIRTFGKLYIEERKTMGILDFAHCRDVTSGIYEIIFQDDKFSLGTYKIYSPGIQLLQPWGAHTNCLP